MERRARICIMRILRLSGGPNFVLISRVVEVGRAEMPVGGSFDTLLFVPVWQVLGVRGSECRCLRFFQDRTVHS